MGQGMRDNSAVGRAFLGEAIRSFSVLDVLWSEGVLTRVSGGLESSCPRKQ